MKNSKSIAHDLNEYHRAEEGSEKHSYDFLDATWIGNDKSLTETGWLETLQGHSGLQRRQSKPDLYIPKGYCIRWNRGVY